MRNGSSWQAEISAHIPVQTLKTRDCQECLEYRFSSQPAKLHDIMSYHIIFMSLIGAILLLISNLDMHAYLDLRHACMSRFEVSNKSNLHDIILYCVFLWKHFFSANWTIYMNVNSRKNLCAKQYYKLITETLVKAMIVLIQTGPIAIWWQVDGLASCVTMSTGNKVSHMKP